MRFERRLLGGRGRIELVIGRKERKKGISTVCFSSITQEQLGQITKGERELSVSVSSSPAMSLPGFFLTISRSPFFLFLPWGEAMPSINTRRDAYGTQRDISLPANGEGKWRSIVSAELQCACCRVRVTNGDCEG